MASKFLNRNILFLASAVFICTEEGRALYHLDTVDRLNDINVVITCVMGLTVTDNNIQHIIRCCGRIIFVVEACPIRGEL